MQWWQVDHMQTICTSDKHTHTSSHASHNKSVSSRAAARLLLTTCRAAVNGYLLPAGPSAAAAAAVAGCDGRTDARQFHRPRYSLHLLTYLSREWYKQLTGSSGCMWQTDGQTQQLRRLCCLCEDSVWHCFSTSQLQPSLAAVSRKWYKMLVEDKESATTQSTFCP